MTITVIRNNQPTREYKITKKIIAKHAVKAVVVGAVVGGLAHYYTASRVVTAFIGY